MPVPNTIDDLSTTAGSNSPAGSETPTEGDNYIRTHGSFIAILRDKLNGTSDTGTIKNATFSGTMAGAASWSGAQTFAAGIAGTTATMTGAISGVGVSVGNSASATATVLDWYEEGTFTPVASGLTSAGTGTYTAQVGRFVRIGRLVFFDLYIRWTAHTGTGFLSIGGLPYATARTQSTISASWGGFGIDLDNWLVDFTATSTAFTLSGIKYSSGANAQRSVEATDSWHINGHYEV